MLRTLPLEVQKGERGVRNVQQNVRRKNSVWKTLPKNYKSYIKKKLELSDTQYCLWARMIVCSIHASKDTPPQVPLITGVTPKRRQSDTFEGAIMHTATAVMKAVTSNFPKSHHCSNTTNSTNNYYLKSRGSWNFIWKGY